jgi:membrane protease YdiL (CAAX protease family)
VIGAVGLLGGVVLYGFAPGGTRQAPGGLDLSGLITLGVWQGLTIALTLVAASLFGGRPRDVLALGPPAGQPFVYIKALLLMLALQAAVTAVQYTYLEQDMYADLRPFVRLFGEQRLAALLVVGLGAPLAEELLFRGFLLSALAASRVGFVRGALLTSALWTALHAGYSAAGIAEVFLIGLYFSWLLWRTGSLWVAILCHALYNSFVVLMLRYVPLPG